MRLEQLIPTKPIKIALKVTVEFFDHDLLEKSSNLMELESDYDDLELVKGNLGELRVP